MKRKYLFLVFLICFVLCSEMLFASSIGQSTITFGAEFCRQDILYSEHYFNKSTIGPGIKADYYYRLDERFSLGAELFAGYFNYKDFHTYYDLRVVGEMRIHIADIENTSGGSTNFSATLGVGPGIAIRDDSKAGAYGLVKGMLSAAYEFPNGMAAGIDLEGSATFQSDESTVTMLAASLGFTIPIGGEK